MAGIYIHIPFCKTRCIYCDFFSRTSMEKKAAFVDCLCNELEMRKDYLQGEKVNTIYIGGGTPSQLNKEDFACLFRTITGNYPLSDNTEITIEANPDDLNTTYIEMFRQFPFNRLSIGIQSFNDDELKFLNRRHTAGQAKEAIKECQQAGFDNISIDLMYGLPNQTLDSWKHSLYEAINSGVQHISSYHLIYEENTALYHLLEKGKIKPVGEETSNEMFLLMKNILTEAGFIHYEISNFAREGYFSRHNSSYWTGEKYLGAGSSAHSYNGESREWNVSSLDIYMECMRTGERVKETEILDERLKYNDYILTGLRTMWGIDLTVIEKTFGKEMLTYALANAAKHIENGYILKKGNNLSIAEKGWLVSDGIMSDLMAVD